MFEFLAQQRGDRSVVRMADRESGLSARTIARRLSSVSGFYAYLIARGDTGWRRTRCRGGWPRAVRAARAVAARAAGAGAAHAAEILSPAEVDRLVAALRTDRDRAMVAAMLFGGLRRCEVLGLRFADVQVADRRVFIVEGKGGHHRVVPIANRFFDALGDYLHDERPATARTDRVFVVLKGPRRGQPLSCRGTGRDPRRCAPPGRAGARHLPPVAAHLPDPAAGGRDGVGSGAGPGRAPLDRVDPDLSASDQRLAGRVSTGARPR